MRLKQNLNRLFGLSNIRYFKYKDSVGFFERLEFHITELNKCEHTFAESID